MAKKQTKSNNSSNSNSPTKPSNTKSAAKTQTPKNSQTPKKRNRHFAKIILVSFLLYCLFWVSCDSESGRTCPISPTLKQDIHLGYEKISPVIEGVTEWSTSKILEPYVYPAIASIKLRTQPHVDKFASSKIGKIIIDRSILSLNNLKRNWHSAAVTFVDIVLPTISKHANGALDFFNEYFKDSIDWIKNDGCPLVKSNIAKGAKNLRSTVNNLGVILQENLSKAQKNTSNFYHQIITSQGAKSFLSNPNVNEFLKNYNMLVHPYVEKVGVTVCDMAFIVLYEKPAQGLDYIWKILEQESA